MSVEGVQSGESIAVEGTIELEKESKKEKEERERPILIWLSWVSGTRRLAGRACSSMFKTWTHSY